MRLHQVIPALAIGFITAHTAVAALPHFEGFEDSGWTAGQTDNWQDYQGAEIQRVVSGAGGITSSTGSAHATISVGNGPFTRLGGYSSSFGGGYIASLDIYLNTDWTDGQGFDYSVASSNQSGNHLRDFIFHVGVVGGELLVNASNNSDLGFNAFKLNNENAGNNFTVETSGWYTFEQVFYDNGGILAVDLNLYDSSDNLLYSITRSAPGDSIATTVGGNRYGWFTYNNIDGLAIDSTSLQAVPEPASLALTALGGFAIFGRRNRHD